ncbi:amino acid ABC transporter permease [Marinobacterium mangrovicola]|uniref:Putative glutamine transport system permease protein GlnP n=1 Tax=Marinobacterium mangrovicola TaxID=1476959 RepID=A0A4R1GLZ1_9GAMM|nr:amino acid ABC transporter permease [Marinobacterium mangrovicola]TCK07179.1 amino acid ABC transporter membrane protein 1 (PAAT family) [Marinobacterium mangrovicola]
MFDLGVVWEYRGALLNGLWMTFWISGISIFFGFIIGALICQARRAENPVIRGLATVYISALRGTPILIQLAIIFFFLPLAGINIPSILAAIIALSLNSSAFQAEILRGGFQMLPKGQLEAAWDFGFSRWQSLIHVELPQVARNTLPALVNDAIDIIKNSSLISTIAVTELMRVAQQYSSTTYRPIEFFIAAGLLYLVLTTAVSQAGQYLERRLSYR